MSEIVKLYPLQSFGVHVCSHFPQVLEGQDELALDAVSVFSVYPVPQEVVDVEYPAEQL